MLKLSHWQNDIYFETPRTKYPFNISFLMCGDKINAIRIGCLILPYDICLALTSEEMIETIKFNHTDIYPNAETFAKSQAERFKIAITLQGFIKEYESKKYNILWLIHKCEKEL